MNCRHCDRDMDDEGTGNDMHAGECVIGKLRFAIAKIGTV